MPVTLRLDLANPQVAKLERRSFRLQAEIAGRGLEAGSFAGEFSVALEGKLVALCEDAPLVPFAGGLL